MPAAKKPTTKKAPATTQVESTEPTFFDIDQLAIDHAAADEGKWFEVPGTNGAEIQIRRFANEDIEVAQANLALENWDELHPEAGDEAAMKDAKRLERELQAKLLSEKVIVNWKGFGSKGKPLEFSPQKAYEYLADPRFDDLRKFVQRMSASVNNWREKSEAEVTDEVKNTAGS